MFEISAATELLKAGHSIVRVGSRANAAVYFLHHEDGKQYLFQRIARATTGKVEESPAVFDWDDMTATNWEVACSPLIN